MCKLSQTGGQSTRAEDTGLRELRNWGVFKETHLTEFPALVLRKSLAGTKGLEPGHRQGRGQSCEESRSLGMGHHRAGKLMANCSQGHK